MSDEPVDPTCAFQADILQRLIDFHKGDVVEVLTSLVELTSAFAFAEMGGNAARSIVAQAVGGWFTAHKILTKKGSVH